MLWPGQIADLWPRVDTLERPTSNGVPESDSSVRRATTTSQQAVLMGWPGYCLDGSKMLGIRLHGTDAASVPDKQLVVITTWCQVLMIWRPLQAAHLTYVKQFQTMILSTEHDLNTSTNVNNSKPTICACIIGAFTVFSSFSTLTLLVRSSDL